ncbi:MAG: hypothetical protein U0326_36145 [Polyangiales bacterium]
MAPQSTRFNLSASSGDLVDASRVAHAVRMIGAAAPAPRGVALGAGRRVDVARITRDGIAVPTDHDLVIAVSDGAHVSDATVTHAIVPPSP